MLTNTTYTFGEKIGEGFFGLVFSCVDVWNNSLAVKVLKAKAPYAVIEKAARDEFEKLMVVRHPYVTYVFDVFHLDETIYIVTERCHCPLSNLFALDGFDGKLWIKAIARCLLQAVNYLHLHGYVHQDIHLNNVFASYARDELIENPHGALNFKLGDLNFKKNKNQNFCEGSENDCRRQSQVGFRSEHRQKSGSRWSFRVISPS